MSSRNKEDTSDVIYGTITILALVLEEHPEAPWRVVGTIVAATLALAVARAYAGTVAETLSRGEPLKRSQLRAIWREARPVMVYAQLPTLAFVLSALGLFPLGLVFWIAEAVGLFILFARGLPRWEAGWILAPSQPVLEPRHRERRRPDHLVEVPDALTRRTGVG